MKTSLGTFLILSENEKNKSIKTCYFAWNIENVEEEVVQLPGSSPRDRRTDNDISSFGGDGLRESEIKGSNLPLGQHKCSF